MHAIFPPLYLFLDFDGVLHSEGGDVMDLFTHADRYARNRHQVDQVRDLVFENPHFDPMCLIEVASVRAGNRAFAMARLVDQVTVMVRQSGRPRGLMRQLSTPQLSQPFAI